MNNSTDDRGLLQEIEEDLQRQRLEALWKKLGPYVLALALGIVLVTAAVTGWRSYRTSDEQAKTSALIEAVNQGKAQGPDALASFAQKAGSSTQALFARLHEAAALLEKGKRAEAVAIYDRLADDKNLDAVFRDLASLLAVQTEMDSGDPAKLAEKLQPLMAEDGAWRFLASEYAGYLALKTGDKEKAGNLFEKLVASPDAPKSVKARAEDMMIWLKEEK